jgi:transposase-like protein
VISIARFRSLAVTLSLGIFLGGSAFAQGTKAPGGRAAADPAKSMIDAFTKNLQPAALTQEQSAKIDEIFGKAVREILATRKEAGLTPKMMRDRQQARKKATDEGKKGKEIAAAVDTAVPLTEAQKKTLEETELQLSKARYEFSKLLSADQIAKLPEPFKKNLTTEPKQKKGRPGK